MAESSIGKFEIQRELGHGGMGRVYLCRDRDLDRDVAVKILDTRFEGAENALRRFQEEARAIAALDSPHIVRIYEFSSVPPRPYIAMEYVHGSTVADHIAAHAPLPVVQVIECARDILEGLRVAHGAGIIHRDIKPANILISGNGLFKLTDFGLARSVVTRDRLTAEGAVVGTVHYLAPEVARGEEADKQSDLYSLGITLFEMLTGEVPFEDESPLRVITRIARETPPPLRQRRSDAPPAFAAWLDRLLAADRDKRYASAEAAMRDLETIVRRPDTPPADAPSEAMTQTLPSTETTDPLPPDNHEGISGDALQSVLQEAMRIEKEGRDVLREESVVEIAAEVGVSADAVRHAMQRHRQSLAKTKQHRRRLRLAAAIAVPTILLVMVGYFLFRRPPREERSFTATGGFSGQTAPTSNVETKAAYVTIDADWTNANLRLLADSVLLVRVADANAIDIRIPGASPVRIEGAYYGAPGTGALEWRAVSGQARAAAMVAHRLRLAVLPFTGGKAETELGDLADGIGDAVTTRLAQRNVFEVIERVQVDRIVENLKLENTEFFDPSTASEIGKMLGTDFLVGGAVQRVSGRYRLSARRVEASTGRVRDNVILDGTEAELFSLQDRLAARLADAIAATELDRFLPEVGTNTNAE